VIDREYILRRFKKVKSKGDGKYQACCPAHDDSTESLSLTFNDDRVLVNCFAGCEFQSVLAAAGLEAKDLFRDSQRNCGQYIKAPEKPEPPADPPRQKDSDVKYKYICTYYYTDEDGRCLFAKERLERIVTGKDGKPKKEKITPQYACYPDGKAMFETDKTGKTVLSDRGRPKRKGLNGVRRVVYNLNKIKNETYVIFVEGEKDVHTLGSLGYPATTVGGAGTPWTDDYGKQLKGKTVYFFPDNDPEGYNFVEIYGKELRKHGCRVLYLDWKRFDREFYKNRLKGDITDYLNEKKSNPTETVYRALGVCTLQFENSYKNKVVYDSLEWDSAIPLKVIKAWKFPVNSLPPKLKNYIAAMSDFYACEPQMPFGFLIGILGAALQSRYRVEINNGYCNELVIQSIVCNLAGARKGAVMSKMMKPVYQWEKERRDESMKEVAEKKVQRAELQKQIDVFSKSGKPIDEGNRAKYTELVELMEKFEPVYPFRLVYEDITPEAMQLCLARQKGKAFLAFPEGGDFFLRLKGGVYNSGTDMASIILNGYNGEPLNVTRKGKEGEGVSIFVPHTYVSLAVAVQNYFVEEFMSNSRNHQRGFVSRMLFSLCIQRIFSEIDGILDDETVKYYEDALTRCFDGPGGTCRFSGEAQSIRKAYYNSINEKMKVSSEDENAFLTRAKDSMSRIAAILELWERVGENDEICTDYQISVDNVKRAIDIQNYYIRTFEIIMKQSQKEIISAQAMARWFVKTETRTIALNTLYKTFEDKLYKNAAERDKILEVLENNYYIYVEKPEKKTRGRPTTYIHVNPELFENPSLLGAGNDKE